jgi:hypothetical protein
MCLRNVANLSGSQQKTVFKMIELTANAHAVVGGAGDVKEPAAPAVVAAHDGRHDDRDCVERESIWNLKTEKYNINVIAVDVY